MTKIRFGGGRGGEGGGGGGLAEKRLGSNMIKVTVLGVSERRHEDDAMFN